MGEEDLKMFTFVRNIKYGVSNLVNWFPIIWNDRDWDYHFIYIILHKKLKRMENSIRYAPFVNAEKRADEIKLCVNLLDRLKKDVYIDMTEKSFIKRWGKCKFNTTEKNILNIVYEKDPENIYKTKRDKELRCRMNHEEYLINQDLSMLFNTMTKCIRGWWD